MITILRGSVSRMAPAGRDRQRGMRVASRVTSPTSPAVAGSTLTKGPRVVAAALALILCACGTRTSYPGQDPFSGDVPSQQIRVNVRNNNFYDASLMAISDTGRRRLGTVGGNQSAVFSMPLSFVSGLRIEIDLLAGPTCVTDFITVSPGSIVDLEIAPDLDTMPNCN